MIDQISATQETYNIPALTKMLAAFPQSREKSNGYYAHPDNPKFDFRVRENGSISIHSWTGRSEEEILALGGLKKSDIALNGSTYTGPTKDTLDLGDIAQAKLLPPQFLINMGLQSGYTYHGRRYVKIAYYNADGTENTKVRVRKALSGEYKQVWDEGTPGDIIPYGLHKLDMCNESGYLLIGEGESDAWTCWYHDIPYLGIPGASMQKTLKHVDINALPPKIYILHEPDQAEKLKSSGIGFYKNVHNNLRYQGYRGEIFCIQFKDVTGCKDPSDLHIKLWPEKQSEQFADRMQKAMQKAIPANDVKDETPVFAIQDERVLKAIVERNKQEIYALAPEITEMSDVEQDHIRLAIQDVFDKSFPMREFNGLLKSAKTENERNKMGEPSPISAKDLMKKQFAPIEYAVPDILPMGLIILGGKQKIGKSWLDLNLSLAVASGGIALGKYPVKQGDVLYLALEDTERRLQDRIAQLLSPGSEAPVSLEIETKWPRMDSKGIAALEKWLLTHPNARMIIIDPWVKVKPQVRSRQGETGYDADYEALAGIKDLADRYGVCILIQFHLRKQSADDPFDEVNATTGATACADGFVSIKRGRGEGEGTLYASGRDYKEEVNLALSFKDGMWKVLGDGQAAVYYGLSPERRAVIDLLCSAIQPSSPKDLAVLLAVPDGTMRKRLFDMKDAGQVEWKEENGVSGYVSLIPSPKNNNKDAFYGNGGNGGNEGNNGNGSNATSTGSDITESVTENSERYREEDINGNGHQVAPEASGDTLEGGSVTAVTDVTMNSNFLAEEEDIAFCATCLDQDKETPAAYEHDDLMYCAEHRPVVESIIPGCTFGPNNIEARTEQLNTEGKQKWLRGYVRQ